MRAKRRKFRLEFHFWAHRTLKETYQMKNFTNRPSSLKTSTRKRTENHSLHSRLKLTIQSRLSLFPYLLTRWTCRVFTNCRRYCRRRCHLNASTLTSSFQKIFKAHKKNKKSEFLWLLCSRLSLDVESRERHLSSFDSSSVICSHAELVNRRWNFSAIVNNLLGDIISFRWLFLFSLLHSRWEKRKSDNMKIICSFRGEICDMSRSNCCEVLVTFRVSNFGKFQFEYRLIKITTNQN